MNAVSESDDVLVMELPGINPTKAMMRNRNAADLAKGK